jgi:hypothetical protein
MGPIGKSRSATEQVTKARSIWNESAETGPEVAMHVPIPLLEATAWGDL